MKLSHIGCASLVLAALVATPLCARAQANTEPAPTRNRRYKAPPETSKIEILVTRHSNGKPIMNAAVVLNSTLAGKDIGTVEVKTDPDGKAMVDVIPRGATVRVQIIASGLATFAQDYTIPESERHIEISMLRPRAQVSAYEDNSGKASTLKPGMQEPVHRKVQIDPKTGLPIPPPSNQVPVPDTKPAPQPNKVSDPNTPAPVTDSAPHL